MRVLGIANDETASACLAIGNNIVAAASEERFSRKKMDNSWPEQAIRFVLNEYNLELADLDYVGYGWSKGFNVEEQLPFYFDRIVEEAQDNPEGLPIFKERIEVEIKRDQKKRNEFKAFVQKNNLQSKVIYFYHHQCHAISAFACSPFEEALVVTCDGRGDFESATVSTYNNHESKVLYRSSSIDSLGFFYGRITALLGFTPHRHEGKIAGLAAHGDPSKYLWLMEKMIYYRDGKVYARSGNWFRPFYSIFSDELTQIIKNAKREDIAAAAQTHLENILAQLVEYYLKRTGVKNVCLAGGTFANVRVNQKILEILKVENIFVQPHMGDGGLALGAAIGPYFNTHHEKVFFSSMYLGPRFSDQQIEKDLKQNHGLKYTRIETEKDMSKQVVNALKNNQVVGLFRGRMEFGPRALCNRSILYHCNDKEVNGWLNKRMERTEFMPFAPVTSIELAKRCYLNWREEDIASRYMTVTYECTEEMINNCPAVVHVDRTARPQIVSKEDNSLMHQILTEWHGQTNGLSLINTSFNKHEEPIVCAPHDAFLALESGIVDVLCIGSYLVQKSVHPL